MKIRAKILAGFIILALMLLVAGIVSLAEQANIRNSMHGLLDDHYRSIDAGKQMLDALEREDSGLLLLIAGDWKQGRKTIQSGDSLFRSYFQVIRGNISNTDEKEISDQILTIYMNYKSIWERPVVGTSKEGNISWYYSSAHPAFKEAKAIVTRLIDLNQKMMYESATSLKNRSNRTVMPAIIAVVSAFVFTMVFNFFINYYVVSPIIRITKGIEQFITSKRPFNVEIDTKDEILDLKNAVNDLIARK